MRACVTCKVVVRGVRDELTESNNHDKTHYPVRAYLEISPTPTSSTRTWISFPTFSILVFFARSEGQSALFFHLFSLRCT